jgi:hypothetical protein
MSDDEIDEFEIQKLADSLGLDTDGWGLLREFVVLNLAVHRRLIDLEQSLQLMSADVRSAIDANRFLPLLESAGFTPDGAWGRLDDIDQLASVPEIHESIARLQRSLEALLGPS